MSKDNVRELAEEIARDFHGGSGMKGLAADIVTEGDFSRAAKTLESRLRSFLEEREAALRGQLTALRGALEDQLIQEDFNVRKCDCGADAPDEFEDLEHYDDCPLADGSGEKEARVIEAAAEVRREELAQPFAADRYVTSINRFRAAVDALEEEGE